MQSADTERALACLDRELIEKTVLKLLDQRTQNDLESMLKVADPNIVYEVRGSRRIYPYFGRREGIAEIGRMLKQQATEFENLGSRVHRLVIDGNDVVLERTAKLRHRGTNAVADIDIVNFLRFNRGLVVEISEHVDTAAIERLINPPPLLQGQEHVDLDAEMPLPT